MAAIDSWVVGSASMRRVAELIANAARSREPVLVVGETGAGKTRVAYEIHLRGGGDAATFETLSPSAYADGGLLAPRLTEGTVYLPRFDTLDPARRLKLLASLASRRIVASMGTEGDLEKTSTALRSFAREGVIVVRVPALRERREDIVALADALLLRFAIARSSAPFGLSPEAATALEAYAWPGNVGELETVLGRAVAVAPGQTIGREHLPPEVLRGGTARATLPADLATLQYREVVAHARDLLSREYLVAVLRAENGSVKHAASRAGIERESLHRLMKRYGVRADAFRSPRRPAS